MLRGGGLLPLARAIGTARRAQRLARQNIGFAFGYNILAVPVAIAGFTPPSADILLLNVAIGVLTGLAMTAVLAAFQMTAVARVAPFQYSQLVWAVLLGWLIFGDMPTPRLALGAALVIASGVLVLRRDRYAASRAQVESATSLANRHSSTEET